MALLTLRLYGFLGMHSFLIGLFPFYIPVYLFTKNYSLPLICYFIAVTGVGFCLSLYLWDRISKHVSLHYLIIFSFLSELALLSLFFLENKTIFVVLAGFFNGVFNCNFWIIQRLLFLETITPHNSGKKFGNFQVFVMLVLKLGIFVGGALLESVGYFQLYIFSSCIVVAVTLSLLLTKAGIELDSTIVKAIPLSIRAIAGYKDRLSSRFVFAVDGVFLYLESYFWVISLFLIVQQNFLKLGLLVVLLTLLFGSIFVTIKNSIDKLPLNKMYIAAVVLYCLSWILRGLLYERLSYVLLLVVLAVLTFCSSIFRLAFNKRFFDIAKSTTAHEYIFVKSYFSQFFLAIIFFILGFFIQSGEMIDQFSNFYFIAAPFSLIYLIYRRPEPNLPL